MNSERFNACALRTSPTDMTIRVQAPLAKRQQSYVSSWFKPVCTIHIDSG